MVSDAEQLRLEPMDERGAAEIGARTIPGDAPATIGRSRESELCLSDPSVSRRHARLSRRHDRWFVEDLGGRHGTYVNGSRIEAERPAMLAQGDFLRIGPYTLRVVLGGSQASTLARTQRETAPDTIVERVSHREMGALAQRRLEVLIDGAVAIHQAADEESLGRTLVELALSGTGFPRAAVLRPTGSADQVEIVAARDLTASGSAEFSFSSSLLREAASGHLARLSRRGGMQLGQSIEQLGIVGALCAPIVLDASVVGYVYLDSRADEEPGFADAAGFCHAVSRLGGLALANLKRAELEKRQRGLEQELEAARHVQAVLCPTGEGEAGPLRYAVRLQPGRFVAGDLFDIFEIDERRVGICFGDVSGHGVAAALQMATVLAHMRAILARHAEPGAAIRDVNRYVTERSPENMFVTMWVAVFDSRERSLRFVDAGHGHWALRRSGGTPEPAGRPGGLLVGIDPEYPYEASALTLSPGDRVILYSDGITEQTSPAGEEFGKAGALEILTRAASPAEDVSLLFHAVSEFAGSYLNDDTTIASFEVSK